MEDDDTAREEMLSEIINTNEVSVDALPSDTDISFPLLWIDTNRQVLVTNMLTDDSKAHCRQLGEMKSQGFFFKDDILFHTIVHPVLGDRQRIVVPKQLRQVLLETAHDKQGHFAKDKTYEILSTNFYWPYMKRDIGFYFACCITCICINKSGPKPSPIQCREVISEPFDKIV